MLVRLMKFTIAKEHKDFFHKNGFIEFEQFIPASQIDQVNKITFALGNKPDEQFSRGFGLWRSHPELRKFISQPKICEIVVELFEKKPLRIGYDQFLPSSNDPLFQEYGQTPYYKFIREHASLEQISSIKSILCGVLISLSTSTSKDSFFPSQAGNAVFIDPKKEIDFSKLQSPCYLIVYTQEKSYYEPQPKDPHATIWKEWGYAFHDHLNEKLNPIMYR